MQIVVPDEYKSLWEQNDEQPVVKYPAPVLRTPAEAIPQVTEETRSLAKKMERIMNMANGIGLAAPQVGISQRLILIAPDHEVTALVNPVIMHSEGSIIGEEGCLSLPGLYGDVERRASVVVRALDLQGREIELKLDNLGARVVQHEIDHLDGVLFIDKVDLATLHWARPVGAATD